MWILFAGLYGIIIGFYTVVRKIASDKSNILLMIAMSSSLGVLLVSWTIPEAFAIDGVGVAVVLGKATIIIVAWVLELLAFKYYYMSSLQPIKAINVVITFFLSLLIFNEPFIWWKLFGVFAIFTALILLNLYDRKILQRLVPKWREKHNSVEQLAEGEKKEQKQVLAIFLFIGSCLLNTASGILDKFFLEQYSASQLQFWFLLFLSVIAWIIIIILSIKQRKILLRKSDWKNWYIYLSGLLLVVADRFLFMALADPTVLVSEVSMLKQLSTVTAVIFGGILYKEPGLKFKLIFLAVILVGIVVVLV